MTVTGEMAVMLDVLGLRRGDDRILKAWVLVGPDMTIEEFDLGDVRSTYYIFRATGTDILFEDDTLSAVMVRTQPEEEDHGYGLYPSPSALIDGLSPTATRGEVADFFGAPERVGPNFVRYEANDHYLHVEFNSDGRIGKLSALLEAV
ncbi:hypothetical protein [Promicromonospora soli]